ncbi:MAG: hypothetical protein M3442_14825 [Chloroflexota bacterium]|nr:hypothetical protein [Chloroflexota bacterium]
MADRDEVQVARWSLIRERVGECLRDLRLGSAATSQARLSGDLEDLGYHVTQSMISRYEQGLLEAPLTLERLVGWALCCASLSAPAFRELMELAGYYLPWSQEDLARFDRVLRQYRALPLPDQIVLRRSLLWHVLGLREAFDAHADGVSTNRGGRARWMSQG